MAHRGGLKANESIQIGKVCSIEVDVESREYRKGHRSQNDASDDPENNTGRAIISQGDKYHAKLGRELSNKIVRIQHAICHGQPARCFLWFHSVRIVRMISESRSGPLGTTSGSFSQGTFLQTPPCRLSWITPPKSTGLLCDGASASQQMEDEEHDTNDEDDVNESTGNVKCEKPE